jgi:hypothetical protein
MRNDFKSKNNKSMIQTNPQINEQMFQPKQ